MGEMSRVNTECLQESAIVEANNLSTEYGFSTFFFLYLLSTFFCHQFSLSMDLPPVSSLQLSMDLPPVFISYYVPEYGFAPPVFPVHGLSRMPPVFP